MVSREILEEFAAAAGRGHREPHWQAQGLRLVCDHREAARQRYWAIKADPMRYAQHLAAANARRRRRWKEDPAVRAAYYAKAARKWAALKGDPKREQEYRRRLLKNAERARRSYRQREQPRLNAAAGRVGCPHAADPREPVRCPQR